MSDLYCKRIMRTMGAHPYTHEEPGTPAPPDAITVTFWKHKRQHGFYVCRVGYKCPPELTEFMKSFIADRELNPHQTFLREQGQTFRDVALWDTKGQGLAWREICVRNETDVYP